MAYDRLAESIRLLTQGLPDVLPPRLSRRVRFSPLSFDVDGDVAATLFVRRGVSGRPWLEAWTLQRSNGEWQMLGGGSGTCDHNPLAPRPPAEQLGGYGIWSGGGWSRRPNLAWYSFRARGVSYAEVRVATEVHSCQAGRRTIVVPPHGHLIVVWGGHKPPSLEGLSEEGIVLAVVDPAGSSRGRSVGRRVRSFR